MIYICEKCSMVFNSEYELTECETCGYTYIRRADEREIADIVGSILLNNEESVLLKEERSVKHHK